MNSLFNDKEIKVRDLKRDKSFWNKEYKNNKSRYSDFYILKQIELIDNELKEGRIK